MMLYTSLLYNTTPIHCTPSPSAPLCDEHPVEGREREIDMDIGVYTYVYVYKCVYVYVYVLVYVYI